MDLIGELACRNQVDLIEEILQYSGYEGVLSMLCVCKSWNRLLTDIGLWRRLYDRRKWKDGKFERFCEVNGWDDISQQNYTWREALKQTKKLAYFFYATTDLKDKIRKTNDNQVEQIRTYSMINTLAQSGDFLVCGSAKGKISVWDFSKPKSGENRRADFHMNSGHTGAVYALKVIPEENLVISTSGGADRSIKVHDLATKRLVDSFVHGHPGVNCQSIAYERESGTFVMWYRSEPGLHNNMEDRSQGELVMWRLNAQTRNENNNELPEDVEEIQNLNHLIPDDQIHFLVKSSLQNQADRERVRIGAVSDKYSVVVYPSQILYFVNSSSQRKFIQFRTEPLEKGRRWVYLLDVYKGLMAVVFRTGAEGDNTFGLIDDIVHIRSIADGSEIRRIHWKWQRFSPLKSFRLNSFGFIAANTSERAYLWHWDDLYSQEPDKAKPSSQIDVAPNRQSNFSVQWRHRNSVSLNCKAGVLLNEQRSHLYISHFA